MDILSKDRAPRAELIAEKFNKASKGERAENVLAALVLFVSSGIFEHVPTEELREKLFGDFMRETRTIIDFLEANSKSGADMIHG